MIPWQALIAAALSCAVVCYTHYEIPAFTRGTGKRHSAHLVLVAVGLAFGAMCAHTLDLPTPGWLIVLLGFGAVHMPAAAILALKRLRGSGKS
ncbi:hypothetical protein [Caballeronia sp. S22]|uniref:hypothetical protein n=1 Tax=Caballeronia sp. S22 TaxID=3137182 RepID=UPI003530701A